MGRPRKQFYPDPYGEYDGVLAPFQEYVPGMWPQESSTLSPSVSSLQIASGPLSISTGSQFPHPSMVQHFSQSSATPFSSNKILENAQATPSSRPHMAPGSNSLLQGYYRPPYSSSSQGSDSLTLSELSDLDEPSLFLTPPPPSASSLTTPTMDVHHLFQMHRLQEQDRRAQRDLLLQERRQFEQDQGQLLKHHHHNHQQQQQQQQHVNQINYQAKPASISSPSLSSFSPYRPMDRRTSSSSSSSAYSSSSTLELINSPATPSLSIHSPSLAPLSPQTCKSPQEVTVKQEPTSSGYETASRRSSVVDLSASSSSSSPSSFSSTSTPVSPPKKRPWFGLEKSCSTETTPTATTPPATLVTEQPLDMSAKRPRCESTDSAISVSS